MLIGLTEALSAISWTSSLCLAEMGAVGASACSHCDSSAARDVDDEAAAMAVMRTFKALS